MIDEHKLLRDNSAAVGAQALLENDILKDAFAKLEEAYTTAWRNTTIEDVSAREKLFLAINVVGKVRDHLLSILANGRLATAELKQLAEVAERKRKFGTI